MRSVKFDIGTSSEVKAAVMATETGNGQIKFDLAVGGTQVGDLRGLFFHVADERLLSGLRFTGDANLTKSVAGANAVRDLGNGANMNGAAGPFDVGVEFGTSGIGKDDVRTASFTLSHSSQPLTLDFIAQQNFGARLTSVGAEGGARDGSVKLTAAAPYPVDAINDGKTTDEDHAASANVLTNDID